MNLTNQVMWGKFAGGVLGFMFGQWLGALVGVVVGHQFDVGLSRQRAGRTRAEQDVREVQFAFFSAVFAAMGRMAKADGRVSEHEIRVAREIMRRMQLSSEQMRSAVTLFNEGKAADFDLGRTLRNFHARCRPHPDLLRTFLEMQLQIALADGEIHPDQRYLLSQASALFGISRREFERLELLVRRHGSAQPVKMTSAQPLQEAYRQLGVTSDAGDGEVKQAYRRLMNQHHPDKLASRQLPDEELRIAEERTRRIREAYDLVRTSRGMR